ncbi:MAG: hypothetical protein U1E05_19075, partial [Patescibacteria group bacterium]|nr:hypothetical protein [Patescibacteria group bacterium]
IDADWAAPDMRARACERLASQQLAWQQPPESPPSMAECDGVELDSFRNLVQTGQTPPRPLIALRPGMKLGHTRLYAAPQQENPEAVVVDGQTIVRHKVRFTDADAPQAVFTTVPLPERLELEGQRVVIRMRMSSAALNAEMPVVLRLYTESDEGGESWGDLNPSPAPGAEWTEVVFDVAAPQRSSRFTPLRTRSLAVRMENQPGIAAAFTVELADIRVGPPDAMARARRIVLQSIREDVDAARAHLYARRDEVARLEDTLRDKPDLRKAYLASFEAPLPRAAVSPSPPSPKSVLEGVTLPAGALRPAAVCTHTRVVDGRPVLVLDAPDEPADSEIMAEMRDRAGVLQAAGRGPASGVTLVPLHAPAWAPGEPHVYSVRCAVLHGDRITSSSERLVGMRTADVRSGGPDALLRELAPTLADPAADVAALHVFTFNQVEGTVAWQRGMLGSLSAG